MHRSKWIPRSMLPRYWYPCGLDTPMGEVLLDILITSIVKSPRCSMIFATKGKEFGNYPPIYRSELGASNQSLESSLVRGIGTISENLAMSGYGFLGQSVIVCPIRWYMASITGVRKSSLTGISW